MLEGTMIYPAGIMQKYNFVKNGIMSTAQALDKQISSYLVQLSLP